MKNALAALNKHDVKAAGAFFADDLAWMESAMPKDQNKKEMLGGMQDMMTAFPDIKIEPTDIWAAGEYVVHTGSGTGTNTGKSKVIPADKTGKTVTIHYVEIDHLKDGKIDKGWSFYNSAAMMQQLGLMPPPK